MFFFSADCQEPAHVHVQRDHRVAKLWLHDAKVAQAGGYGAVELGRIVDMVRRRRTAFMEAWNEHCHRAG